MPQCQVGSQVSHLKEVSKYQQTHSSAQHDTAAAKAVYLPKRKQECDVTLLTEIQEISFRCFLLDPESVDDSLL